MKPKRKPFKRDVARDEKSHRAFVKAMADKFAKRLDRCPNAQAR